MRAVRYGAVAVILVGLWSVSAVAEQSEVLLGVSMDFDKKQITLEVVSTGCTKKEDFRFEYSNTVLTVIRKERDSCKAMPDKIGLTYPLKEIGLDPHTPFRISNSFVANDMMVR